MAQVQQPKDKSIAIIFAIFLGLFTWVYTYDVDSGKFWGNFAATVFTLGIWGIVAWVWALILAISRSVEFYANYPNVK